MGRDAMTLPDTHEVDVCVVGGGPAGMVAGLLLAHQGFSTLVLEQAGDFEREFRGEVLMPRFAQMMRQVGLLEHLLGYPHDPIEAFEIHWRDRAVAKAPMARVAPAGCPAIWMTQPTLLGALHDRARGMAGFELWFGASARELVVEENRVVGAVVERAGRRGSVRARVTIGADGRTSGILRSAGLEAERDDEPFEVIWFNQPRPAGFGTRVRAYLTPSHSFLIAPKVPDLVQCGLLVPGGTFVRLKKAGVGAMRDVLAAGPALLRDFAGSLEDFRPFHPLQARVSFVREWARDGFLVIGDAAHTCSPAGAVGVSVACATAIVAADVVGRSLAAGDVSARTLGEVQRLRGPDVRRIQAMQHRMATLLLSRFFLRRAFLPWVLPLADRAGVVRAIQRRLLVARKPLPISPALRVDEPVAS